MSAFIADKGYEPNNMVNAPQCLEAEAVLPSRSQRKTPQDYDQEWYKEHNFIERISVS